MKKSDLPHEKLVVNSDEHLSHINLALDKLGKGEWAQVTAGINNNDTE